MQFLKTVVLALTLVFATTGERMEGLQVGDKAVDFNLKNVDGKMISLKTNKNAKGYILVFTCNTCPLFSDVRRPYYCFTQKIC